MDLYIFIIYYIIFMYLNKEFKLYPLYPTKINGGKEEDRVKGTANNKKLQPQVAQAATAPAT